MPAVAGAGHRLAAARDQPGAEALRQPQPELVRRARAARSPGPGRSCADEAEPKRSSQNAAPSATAATPPAATPITSRRVRSIPGQGARARAQTRERPETIV